MHCRLLIGLNRVNLIFLFLFFTSIFIVNKSIYSASIYKYYNSVNLRISFTIERVYYNFEGALIFIYRNDFGRFYSRNPFCTEFNEIINFLSR
jgi:hypothetical protein